MPAVTRVGGRGDGAAVDDGPGCRRRADAAAPSSRGRDRGGRGPKRRVLRQADGGRAQTSLSWLADTLLSPDRAAPIRFCRPTGRRRASESRSPSPGCGWPGAAAPAPLARRSSGPLCGPRRHRPAAASGAGTTRRSPGPQRSARSVSPAAGPVRQHDGGTRVGVAGSGKLTKGCCRMIVTEMVWRRPCLCRCSQPESGVGLLFRVNRPGFSGDSVH